jgi:hypothetical protein
MRNLFVGKLAKPDMYVNTQDEKNPTAALRDATGFIDDNSDEKVDFLKRHFLVA